MLLIRCGAINPTNEIIPPEQTAQDVARVPEISIKIFVFRMSAPKDWAVVSPFPKMSK